MVKFEVEQGDIFEGKADGIVNSIGKNLELGGAVSRELWKRFAGDGNAETGDAQLKQLLKEQVTDDMKPLKPGSLVVTEGGESGYKHIFRKLLF